MGRVRAVHFVALDALVRLSFPVLPVSSASIILLNSRLTGQPKRLTVPTGRQGPPKEIRKKVLAHSV